MQKKPIDKINKILERFNSTKKRNQDSTRIFYKLYKPYLIDDILFLFGKYCGVVVFPVPHFDGLGYCFVEREDFNEPWVFLDSAEDWEFVELIEDRIEVLKKVQNFIRNYATWNKQKLPMRIAGRTQAHYSLPWCNSFKLRYDGGAINGDQ